MIARIELDRPRWAAVVGPLAVHRDAAADTLSSTALWTVSHIASKKVLAAMLDLQVAAHLAWALARYVPTLDLRVPTSTEPDGHVLRLVVEQAGYETGWIGYARTRPRSTAKEVRHLWLVSRDRIRAKAKAGHRQRANEHARRCA